jgi:CheY-like chemotaxis protein
LRDWVEVRVIDTGIGLKPEDLPKVFEKFKQAGDTLTNRPKGTGLGLPICKEIIEAHDGKIWVESEYGKGCEFVFILMPTRAAKTITIKKSQILQDIKEKLYEKIQRIKKGQKILVVDDEGHIRKLLRQELEEVGYKIFEAKNGSDALNKARNIQPDLIILDILMPVIDGYDVITILKNDENTSKIPILIYSIIDDQEKLFDLGADEFISKSAGPETLLQTVSSLIATSSSKQKKVLVIEDNESIIKAIRDALEVRGYEVIVTSDSQEGISTAQTESPDLIIIDGDISRRNNNEILKKLKEEKILVLQP